MNSTILKSEEIKCSVYQKVIKIHTNDAVYITKEALSAQQSEILADEFRILEYLSGTYMENNIPKVLRSEKTNAFYEEYINGKTLTDILCQNTFSAELCDELISVIKKLHSVDKSPMLTLKTECVSWKEYILNTLATYEEKITRSSLDSILFKKVFEFEHSILGSLPNISDETVILHNDLNTSNIIVNDDGNMYLIDFERWTVGDPLKEISKLIWWFRKDKKSGDYILFNLFERELKQYEYDLLKAYFLLDILFHFSLYDTLSNDPVWMKYYIEEFNIISNTEEIELW